MIYEHHQLGTPPLILGEAPSILKSQTRSSTSGWRIADFRVPNPELHHSVKGGWGFDHMGMANKFNLAESPPSDHPPCQLPRLGDIFLSARNTHDASSCCCGDAWLRPESSNQSTSCLPSARAITSTVRGTLAVGILEGLRAFFYICDGTVIEGGKAAPVPSFCTSASVA